MREADLKRTCEDYLQIQQNLGGLMFLRLNSGDAFREYGGRKYRIKLCPEGTADFYVLKKSRSIFIELKGDKGKQSDEQTAFEQAVRRQGADYFVVRDTEDLVTALHIGGN